MAGLEGDEDSAGQGPPPDSEPFTDVESGENRSASQYNLAQRGSKDPALQARWHAIVENVDHEGDSSVTFAVKR